MTTLINSYDEGCRERYGALVEASVAELPYTLAHPLEELYVTVAQENYAKAKDYILEWFELSAQYLSVVLLALLREHAVRHPEGFAQAKSLVEGVVRKVDTKRPLSFGDWCNDILPPLTAAVMAVGPEWPLAKSLARRTTSKNNLFVGSKSEPSIVFYRNQYKGHGTMLTDEKYRQMLGELEPRLLSLLEALEPVRRCTTLAQEGHVWMEGALMGDDAEAGAKVDLFPLLYADESDFVYLFQSLNDEKTYYVSANEQAEARLETDHNSAVDAFFQTFVPAFDIAKRRNWTEWSALLHAATGRFLQGVYRDKKYNRELFVERPSLTALLRDFAASEATLFPLPGEAGQGKTNQLCYWSEELSSGHGTLLPRRSSVLIMAGASLSGTTLEASLRGVLEVSPRKNIVKVLDELHQAAADSDADLLFFIDALNECENYAAEGTDPAPVAFFRDLTRLLVQPQYPHFKVLFTCRNYTWKQLLQPRMKEVDEALVFAGGQQEAHVVRGFNDDELERAYAIYGGVYSVQTPYSDLARALAIRLKDPLVMKITCTNYLGTSLPTTPRSLTSVALWKQLYEGIRLAYAGNRQMEILDELVQALLRSYMEGHPTNAIAVAELRRAYDDAGHPLHRLARLVYLDARDTREAASAATAADGTSRRAISVAFAELINRPERPILRYDEGDKVQFVYERFLEYVLAVFIARRLPAKPDAAAVVDILRSVPADEVLLGAMRNVLIMHYVEHRDSTLLLSLIADHSDDFMLMTLLTDVMNVLVRENYEEEVFAIERDLVTRQVHPNAQALYAEFNGLAHTIETNRADNAVIARFNELHLSLRPVLNLRTMAIQSLLGGIFLTDYFNEDLYRADPFELLWMLTDDPLVEVKDAVCLQSYYVSHQHYTFGGTPIARNLSELIASRMYDWLNSRPVLTQAARGRSRRRMMTFLETATRLFVLLIIDVMLSEDPAEQHRIGEILDRLRATVRHLTLGHSLIRIVLPALNIVMRRQLTFQSDYVNNAIEYQHFWESVPSQATREGDWVRADLAEVMKFVYQYSRYYSRGRQAEAPDFAPYADKLYRAYFTGDSISYFIMERLLVINGTCSWESIGPLLNRLDDDFAGHRGVAVSQWWDYTQMSIIYVLYQLGLKMPQLPDKVMDMLGRWCVDWTRRLHGFFTAPNSHKANPRQQYKRNVMTWYATVCAYRQGDVRREPCQLAPLFYNLIDEAVDSNDGELLAHLMDNISELVADAGYVNTALDLLSHVMRRVDSAERLESLGLSQSMPQQIALLLSTAKSYAPGEVNAFLSNEVLQLPFPGVENYRDEILNYTPCGEKLSDVLTHRFGNFVIFALIHQEDVEEFCYNAAQRLVDTKDFSEWLSVVVRMLLRDMLRIKIKV